MKMSSIVFINKWIEESKVSISCLLLKIIIVHVSFSFSRVRYASHRLSFLSLSLSLLLCPTDLIILCNFVINTLRTSIFNLINPSKAISTKLDSLLFYSIPLCIIFAQK